jgi:hypothetical protein
MNILKKNNEDNNKIELSREFFFIFFLIKKKYSLKIVVIILLFKHINKVIVKQIPNKYLLNIFSLFDLTKKKSYYSFYNL